MKMFTLYLDYGLNFIGTTLLEFRKHWGNSSISTRDSTSYVSRKNMSLILTASVA